MDLMNQISKMTGALAVEMEKYANQQEHLRQLYEDTKECLAQVDYEHHFDKALYAASTWSREEDANFLGSLAAHPRIVVLGACAFARGAVVNELLGCSVLPTVVAEDAAEWKSGASAGVWNPVVISYGQDSVYEVKQSSGSSKHRVDLYAPSSFSPPPESDNVRRWCMLPLKVLKEDDVEEIHLQMAHPLLKDGAEIHLPRHPDDLEGFLSSLLAVSHAGLPLFLYVVTTLTLTELDRRDLTSLGRFLGVDSGVFFIKSRPYVRSDLPECERYGCQSPTESSCASSVEESGDWRERLSLRPANRTLFLTCFSSPNSDSESADPCCTSGSLRQQLVELGLLSASVPHGNRRRGSRSPDSAPPGDLIENSQDFPRLIWFVQRVFRYTLIHLSRRCNEWQSSLLNLFILTAFDMARDQLITPKRLAFARKQEKELYQKLLLETEKKTDEIQNIFIDVINALQSEALVEEAAAQGWSEPEKPEDAQLPSKARAERLIQRWVLSRVRAALAERLQASLHSLQQTYIGTLRRCVEKLEEAKGGQPDDLSASVAFEQLLNAVYNIEISISSGGSLVHLFWERMKQLMGGKGESSGDSDLSPEWQSQMVQNTLNSLRDSRPGKLLCQQLREHIKASHDAFTHALDKMDARHSSRLEETEEQRLRLRKKHAPRLARLVMESLAMHDVLIFGMPKLGSEMGRGQYGVVYHCERWGKFGPCAVKSVVPPDDRHYNDLAMEFYYTKSLPEHERLVRLHGAVIDHNYGGGGGQPAVLLIMERMKRDLYSAIRQGLSWPARLQVALDVIEGMRFLHSQGLVHRDIKLKNVLLDDDNRGRITDLGFCKPEAMMSGSVVGTPIHMAPELFSGNYDSSVDVYAFGVLFWYICAGHVRLPQAFEQCLSKDQLWHSVKKGLRPEQLSSFDQQCWWIMRDCWAGDCSQRPHLGDLVPRLQALMEQYTELRGAGASQPKAFLQFPTDDRNQRQRRTPVIKR